MVDNEKMKEHGYYEVYIPVWNPESEERPVNMVVDIYGDEQKLNSINANLIQQLESYGEHIDNTSYQEQFFADHLHQLLRDNLIMDVYCKDMNIESVNDLKEKLENDSEFEIYR